MPGIMSNQPCFRQRTHPLLQLSHMLYLQSAINDLISLGPRSLSASVSEAGRGNLHLERFLFTCARCWVAFVVKPNTSQTQMQILRVFYVVTVTRDETFAVGQYCLCWQRMHQLCINIIFFIIYTIDKLFYDRSIDRLVSKIIVKNYHHMFPKPNEVYSDSLFNSTSSANLKDIKFTMI